MHRRQFALLLPWFLLASSLFSFGCTDDNFVQDQLLESILNRLEQETSPDSGSLYQIDTDDPRVEFLTVDDADSLEEYLSELERANSDGSDLQIEDGMSDRIPFSDMTFLRWAYDYPKFTYFTKLNNRRKVAKFLKTYQHELHIRRRVSGLAEWKKETNLTTYNINFSKKIVLQFSKWVEKKRNEARKFSTTGLTYNQNRMLKLIKESSALKEDYLRKRLVSLEAKISAIYSKAKVCKKQTGKCYHFEPGLIKLMRKSRNYDELLWAWKGWRDAIGPKVRNDWTTAEKLRNKGARENGYEDTGAYQRSTYETGSFEKEIDELWKTLEPYYMQLHAYIRRKLHNVYGDRVSLTGPIPAHLLGNMWSMQWDGLQDIAQPYPKTAAFAVTSGMLKKNMTVHGMFQLADSFYRSLGLPKMTPQFWKYSMFTRPKDNRSVVCYASAHNLEGDDVRIKMCASVTSEYLYVVHHEMGHCQYYLAYNRHQPEIFQAGANHGFHEAIGDTAALSVISPTHLEKLGILTRGVDELEDRKKKDINFLMQKALEKIAFFPFALTMAKWSWDVASGKIPYEDMNAGWWRYREKYQGIVPPVERTEKDFDPACKYHIANFVPYVRYFVSHVLQFQFFEALCDLAKQSGPLHRCDFAGSKIAGAKFKKMLEMGQSKPWPEALRVLTGREKMNANSVIRYFRPLLTWLEKENRRLGNKIGW